MTRIPKSNSNHSLFLHGLFIYFTFKDGNQQSRTDWHRILITRESTKAYAVNWIEVGDKLYIRGRLQYRAVVNPTTANVESNVAYILTGELYGYSLICET